MADAIRSIPECADSLSIPNEPVRMPVISLRAVTAPAARTEKTAAERLACGAPDCGGVAVLSVVAVGIAAMAPMLQLGRRHCIARHRWSYHLSSSAFVAVRWMELFCPLLRVTGMSHTRAPVVPRALQRM